jgi:hypothetical protein
MVVLVVRFQARLGMAGLRREEKRMVVIESSHRRLFLSRVPKQGGKVICGGGGRGSEG